MAVTLEDVVKELQDTNSQLKAQTQNFAAVKAQLLRDARQKKQEKLDDLEAKRKQNQSIKSQVMRYGGEGKGVKGSLKQGLMEGTGLDQLSKLETLGLGAGAGALAGALARGMGKALGRGALAGIVGLFGEQIIESALKGLSVDDIFNLNDTEMKGLASDINGALVKGIVASIFGKKFGIAVFLGDLISKAISSTLSKESLEKKLGTINLTDDIKYDITNEDLITLGTTVAAFFGPALIYGAITKGLGGTALAYSGAKVGRDPKTGRFTKLKPELRQSFMKGFGSRFLQGAALFAMGESVGAYLDEAASESAGDVARWTGGGMAIGAMFGPGGMIVGAVAGLMIGLGRIVLDYLRETDDAVRNAAVGKAEQILKESGGDANKLNDRQRKDVAQAIQELEKLTLKMKPQDRDATLEKIAQFKKLLEKKGSQQEIQGRAKDAFEKLSLRDYIEASLLYDPSEKTAEQIKANFEDIQSQVSRRLQMEKAALLKSKVTGASAEEIDKIVNEIIMQKKKEPEPTQKPLPGPDIGDMIDPKKTSDVSGTLKRQGLENAFKGELLTEQQNARRADGTGSVNIAPVSVDNRRISGNTTNQSINVSQGSPSTIDQYGLGTPGLGWT